MNNKLSHTYKPHLYALIKTCFFVSLVACVLSFFTCCSQKKTYVIAVSQCSEDSWRSKLNKEIKRESYFYDNVKLLFATSKDDNATQIKQIEQFIAQGVDLLIISPNDAKALSPVINKAFQKKIPVVLVDRKTTSGQYTAFIGADNVEIGRNVGEYMAHQMKGKGTIVEIRGLHTSTSAIERHQGFYEALKRFPHIKIIDAGDGKWFEKDAEVLMDAVLRTQKPFQWVFAQCDRMAFGAHKSLLQHHKDSVNIVSIDALLDKNEGVWQVSEGNLKATFMYPTQGDKVLQLAMNILMGKPYKRETILESGLVDVENASILLKQQVELESMDAKMNNLSNRFDRYLAQYNNQKIILWLTLSVLLLFIISVFLMYRAYLTKLKLNVQLTEKNKEIERISQAKMQFFTDVSHELRTPLTLVATPIEQLLHQEQHLNTSQHELLSIAQRNIETLLRLVAQILNFQKVESGTFSLNLSTLNIIHLWEAVISLFHIEVQTKQLTLQFHNVENKPIYVQADSEKLSSVFTNILSNAVKFTPDGGTITINIHISENQKQVIMQITDTGEGIDDKDLPHIFERFYRANTHIGGTGIGLSLAKSIIELHQGHISVTSKKGKGSCFELVLPLSNTVDIPTETIYKNSELELSKITDKAANSPKPLEYSHYLQSIIHPTSNKHKANIVVIDDNAELCQLILLVLEPHYGVKTFTDAPKAWTYIQQTLPDLVVSDVMMPLLNGIDLCSLIKETAITAHIPVILLTAQTLSQQRINAYKHGADAYVTKPFTDALLMARVQNILAERERLKKYFAQGDTDDLQKWVPQDKAFIEKIRQEIHKNIDNPHFNVERLGYSMQLSRVQMYRKVKALTGVSPVELIRTTRLNKAKRLLEHTDMSASEIAYKVGFTSPSYFAKCYKETFGHSPKGKKE